MPDMGRKESFQAESNQFLKGWIENWSITWRYVKRVDITAKYFCLKTIQKVIFLANILCIHIATMILWLNCSRSNEETYGQIFLQNTHFQLISFQWRAAKLYLVSESISMHIHMYNNGNSMDSKIQYSFQLKFLYWHLNDTFHL